MWRKGPDAVSILNTFPSGPSVFSANQFDFHAQSGVDASLAYDNGCGKGMELRYFWMDEFSDDQGPVPGLNEISTFPKLGVISNALVRYESSLQSIEALRRRSIGRLNVNYGFRYANLTETLTIGNAFVPNVLPFRAQNDLYGSQIGVDGPIWDRGGRFRLNGFAKTGIYWNDASATTTLNNPGVQQVQSGANSNTAALLSECGLSASYDIWRNLSLTAGYQFLFLDGVALGADQVPNTGAIAPGVVGPVKVDKNSLYYHGFNVGVEWRR